MKRLLPLLLTLALCLTACGGEKKSDKTPDQLNEAYAAAITAAQSDDEREAFPQIKPDDGMYELVLGVMGIAPDDVTASALMVSMRGIQAYSIVAVMPAEGKRDTVRKGLEGYIDNQKNTFEFYLEDQYQIAADAKLEELSDGTLLLVMCPDQDTVFDNIKASLEG